MSQFNFAHSADQRSLSSDELCIQLAFALSTDLDVLSNFFDSDEKFVELFLTIYKPCLDVFLTNYCCKLAEANQNISLKSSDGGRE